MYYPIAQSEFAVRPATLAAASTRIGRILVVEDDLETRRSITAYLAEHRCTALGCGALDVGRYLQGPPLSLIIINARLGMLSGLDILRQIRERSHVPVILYRDGQQTPVEPIIGLELGARHLAPSGARPAIRSAIARRPSLQRLGSAALQPQIDIADRRNRWPHEERICLAERAAGRALPPVVTPPPHARDPHA